MVDNKIEVARSDLQAAWMILENLAVSLDQIGGTFGREIGASNGAQLQQREQEALGAYLRPELVKAINDARMRLGQYLPDDEAEALTEQIAYWKREAVTSAISEPA